MAITSLRIARSPSGRLFAAYVDGGALKLDRYDDAEPPVVADTISVVGSGVTSCSLGIQPDGRIDLVTTEGGAVKWRQSSDGGATFGAASTLVAAGDYDQVAHAIADGLFVLVIRDPLSPSPRGDAYSCVAVMASDGSWSWGTPDKFDYSGYYDWYGYGVPYATFYDASDQGWVPAQGRVHRHAGGRWAFGCLVDVGGTGYEPVVYESVQLGSVGQWRENDELWAPFLAPHQESTPRLIWSNAMDFAIDDLSGMLLLMAQRYSDTTWVAVPGKLDSESYFQNRLIWRTQGLVAVVAATANSPGSIWRRADGTWEFAYVPAGTPSAYNIIRCRALAGDGSGSWA